ncbi:MAG: hypothetical protein IPJ40_13045 [Saprospirales bacterium]|nr:hypothetical protein [Saprospirales bacterium]
MDLRFGNDEPFHLEGKADTLFYTLGRDNGLDLESSLGVSYTESTLGA